MTVCDRLQVRVLALALLLAACGDDLPGVGVTEYADAWFEASCRRLVRCGVMPDLATCTRTNRGPQFTGPNFLERVASGAVVWRPELAHACLEEVAAVSCARRTTFEDHLSCRAMYQGTRGDGETCIVNTECTSGECWNEGCTDACCTGVCVGDVAPVPAGLGDSCRYAPCAEGICIDGFCIAYKQEGEACAWDECAPGLHCKSFGSAGELVCARRPDTGEACSIYVGCRSLPDVCGPDYVCRPGVVGASCIIDEECLFHLICDPTLHVCAPNRRTIGDACNADSDCSDLGSRCDLEARQCAWPVADGEPCKRPEDCESHYCDRDARCSPIDSCLAQDAGG